MNILLTTTADVHLMGHGIKFTHPTVDFDIATEISLEDMRRSEVIQNLIDSGSITLKDGLGKPIPNIKDYLSPLMLGEKDSYHGEKDASVSASSAEPYQVYRKLFTPEVSTASYKISWYAEVTTDNNARPFRLQVVLDETEELCDFVAAPAVKGSFVPVCGFAVRTLNNVEHAIDFKISYITRTSVSVRRIRIVVERE